jgi:hypothetical protein
MSPTVRTTIVDKQPDVDVILYICPNAIHCGGYYAAPEYRPDSADLARMQTRRAEDGTAVDSFSRLECPRCRERGIHVVRVPHVVTGVLPLADALKESGTKFTRIREILGLAPTPVIPTIADTFGQ